MAGVDVKTVSHEAGHGSVAFTLDTYAHVLQEVAETASDKRELLLRVAVDHARLMHIDMRKDLILLGNLKAHTDKVLNRPCQRDNKFGVGALDCCCK